MTGYWFLDVFVFMNLALITGLLVVSSLPSKVGRCSLTRIKPRVGRAYGFSA